MQQNRRENSNTSLSPLVLPMLSTLIGCEKETREGLQLLARPEVRLLTLVGVGGVGKTCLAQALAEQARRAFADGVLVGSLAALSQHNLLLPTLLQELGLREEHAQHPRETLVVFLCAKQFLLFLDNFEQIVAAGLYCWLIC